MKINMKIIAISLCVCLLMSFAAPVVAYETNSVESFRIENSGDIYDVTISYNAKGERIATVVNNGVSTTAVFSPRENSVLLTEKSLITGEIKTTRVSGSPEVFGMEASISDIRETESAKYFHVGYNIADGSPYFRWSITNSNQNIKMADETPSNANYLSNFKGNVMSCVAYEKMFDAAVGSTLPTSIINALLRVAGFSAVLAILYALGIAEHPAVTAANAWESASSHADNADYYYNLVTEL